MVVVGGAISARPVRARGHLAIDARVLRYSYPYRWQITAMLALILINTPELLTPLILRTLIDRALPERDLNLLVRLR